MNNALDLLARLDHERAELFRLNQECTKLRQQLQASATLRGWAERHGGYVSFFRSVDSWGRPYRCELVIDGEHERVVRGDSWDEVTREAAELVTRNPQLNLETEQS